MNEMSASRKTVEDSPRLLRSVVRVLDEKKAEDLRVLDVREQSSITDYFVLATGTSEPHLRTLRIELEKALDNLHAPIIGVERGEGSGWTVFDAFEVMVHLFTSANREKYRLELLWKDAVEVSVDGLLKKSPVRKVRRASHPHTRKPV